MTKTKRIAAWAAIALMAVAGLLLATQNIQTSASGQALDAATQTAICQAFDTAFASDGVQDTSKSQDDRQQLLWQMVADDTGYISHVGFGYEHTTGRTAKEVILASDRWRRHTGDCQAAGVVHYMPTSEAETFAAELRVAAVERAAERERAAALREKLRQQESQPDPTPQPTPEPQPTPDSTPDPIPTPEPQPTPEPVPVPPAVERAADPIPEPQPDPTPDSTPEPTPPTPEPVPPPVEPDPIPEPIVNRVAANTESPDIEPNTGGSPETIAETGDLKRSNATQLAGYVLIGAAIVGAARVLIVKKYKS